MNQYQNASMQIQNFKQKEKSKKNYQRIIPTYKAKTPEYIPDDENEKKIEQVLRRARPKFIVDIIKKSDQLTKDDLDIIEEVEKHQEEKQKQVVAEEAVDALICSMSRCSIPGCEVHTLTPRFVHYGHGMKYSDGYNFASIKSMPPRLKRGYALLMEGNCSYVEIYERHFCVVGLNGTTEVLNE